MGGSIELSSSQFHNAASGRPEFQVRMKRGANHDYQVFGLDNGFLLLDLAYADCDGGDGHFDGTLGLIGGVLGGRAGRLIGDALESASQTPGFRAVNHYSGFSDHDLIDIGKKQKGTLLAPYDDISMVSIDKPSMWDAWTRGGACAALITVREKRLKKMVWEVRDIESMETAYRFLPAKLGDRVKVNMDFDLKSLAY